MAPSPDKISTAEKEQRTAPVAKKKKAVSWSHFPDFFKEHNDQFRQDAHSCMQRPPHAPSHHFKYLFHNLHLGNGSEKPCKKRGNQYVFQSSRRQVLKCNFKGTTEEEGEEDRRGA